MIYWKTILMSLLVLPAAFANECGGAKSGKASANAWCGVGAGKPGKKASSPAASMNEVLTDARCVPETLNGQVDGYRCFSIVPGSIYEKIGLQDNDVIYGIDGEKMDDPAKLFGGLANLKGSTSDVSVAIRRDGKDMNLVFKPIKPVSANVKPKAQEVAK